MGKKSNAIAFNKAFKLYVRELIRDFPHVSELKLVHRLYKVSKTINKNLPGLGFYTYLVKPFGPLIKAKKEFFMDPDFKFDFAILAMIHDSMKREWAMLTSEQKEHHWNKLNELMQLCDVIQQDANLLNVLDSLSTMR